MYFTQEDVKIIGVSIEGTESWRGANREGHLGGDLQASVEKMNLE